MSDRNVNIQINGKDNASRAIGTVGKSFDGLTKTLGGVKTLIGGLAVGMAFRAAVGKFNSVAESMDEVGKASDRLGIATERLGGLAWAAEQSGVEFEALSSAITKMNKSLSEVASGGASQTADALSEIGLDIRTLRALTPDKQFGAIADSLNKVADAGDKARIISTIFGRSGPDLINLLNEGSAGFAKFSSEAERMGLLFSREEAAKVEEYNDQVNKLSKSFDGLWQSIVKFAVPSITTGLDRANMFVSGKSGAFRDTFNTSILQSLGGTVGDIRNEPGVASHLRVGPYSPEEAARDAKRMGIAPLNDPADIARLMEDERIQRQKRQAAFIASIGFGAKGKDENLLDLIAGGKGGIGSLFESVSKTGEDIGKGLVKGIAKGWEDSQQHIKDRIDFLKVELRTPAEVLRDGLAEVDKLSLLGLDPETAKRQRASLLADFGPTKQSIAPGLASREFRALTRAPGAGGPELQAVQEAKKQTKIAEKQVLLMTDSNRLLRDIVDQQPSAAEFD